MSAKEMFEKLGYKEKINYTYDFIEYDKIDETHTSEIVFFKGDKTIQAYKYENWKGEDDGYALSITLEELQAINKQVEELGWK